MAVTDQGVSAGLMGCAAVRLLAALGTSPVWVMLNGLCRAIVVL
ncbi:hypothetical protein N8654_01895 [Synechococcus sp. AH-601-B19]|nr:hypothetical protein [Synechococcus sp. AH-601-B19]